MRTRTVALLALFVLVTPLVACGNDDGETASSTTATTSPSGTTSSTAGATSTTTAPEATTPVGVYFVRSEKIATAGAKVVSPAVARGAMRALLAGPGAFEKGIGMTTTIPTGTMLLDLAVADGLATVDLSSEFESGGGSLSMQSRVAQVVFTLTQFDSVQMVSFRIDGKAVDAIGGEGIPATEVTRTDFENVTPLVLVESPTPGAKVTSPLTVSGTSNTFEATVNYRVTDPDGKTIDEGFTTATAGTGTWGTFEFTSTFTTARAGIGAVVAFQVSAADGSDRDVYEVPVRMG